MEGAGKLALLFPGQGAHVPNMLDGLSERKSFGKLYGVIADELGYSPLEAIKQDPEKFNSHLLSSVFTILASALSYERFLETEKRPDYFAGYSVGQFMAMHAAGCFDFAYLIRLTKVRSTLLDECAQSSPGAMLAVVGLGPDPVANIVSEVQQSGEQIYISNFNCFGQYSLSGTKQGVSAAMSKLAALDPKRLIELPVAGAWHSPMLSKAGAQFADYLSGCTWRAPEVPVIDNVTGQLLPSDVESMKVQLVSHVTSPVKWDTGVKTLVGLGCDRFIEVGYGNVLTKFGFMIDRHAEFSAYFGGEPAKAQA